MSKYPKVLFAALLATTIAHAGESPQEPLAPRPAAFSLMGNGGPNVLPGSCEVGVDRQKLMDGQQLNSVRCTNTVVPSFGGSYKQLNATEYNGKRVRISAWLMASGIEDVTTPQYSTVTGEAGLWLAVGSTRVGTTSERTMDRTLKGSTGWVQLDFVVDLPQDAKGVMLGFWMQGKGQVWARDMAIEAVANTVPLTARKGAAGPDLSLDVRPNTRPDARFQPPPQGWLALGGQGFELCDIGVDVQMLKQGQRNLSIACSISASPTLRQAFLASPFWDKRVRFSGWIKTENVESLAAANGRGGASLFLSASDTQTPVASVNITGTTAWQYYELVMDIPRNSVWIPLGLALNGRGQVWGRDFKFEEISGDTPITPALIR